MYNSSLRNTSVGVEKSGSSSRASKEQTCQVRLPGVTGKSPAPTAVNNNGAALASVSVNVMGGQGTMPSSRQAMAATSSNFVYEGSSIAQEHTERDAAVKVLRLHMSAACRAPSLRCRDVCLTVLLQLT